MGKLIDLTNQRFGFWIVLKQEDKSKSGQTQWLCQCECGIKKTVTSNSLRSGNSTSCGCNHSTNLIGKKFGCLSVLDTDYSKGRKYWLCKCDCGEKIITSTQKLNDKRITSCGCKIECDDDQYEDLPNITFCYRCKDNMTSSDVLSIASQITEVYPNANPSKVNIIMLCDI